ncbi:hypothetical protein [Caulobacter mirabilis]|uniref:Uncharacterized protein n=1 Tax=Caulobacter mirabilis TaxID=69666 RepID=A0A2D2AYF9_9CAUL|nr:hypothetical protein [Caulobacter mirabilis]ATQ43023.1 hypothetical protein CSW64_11690 [Caulobacter mirabilis]
MENPLFVRKLDRSVVMGELKSAGSKDPDILQATRSRLLASSKSARLAGWGLIGCGVVFGLTIIGLPATIAMVPMGVIALLRAQGNISTVDRVFAEYTGAI